MSFSGSVVTFAKLQELMTSRPVVFPGLPFAFGGAFVAALVLAGVIVDEPVDLGRGRARRWSASRWASCSCCRSAAPTYRS